MRPGEETVRDERAMGQRKDFEIRPREEAVR